jgi:hypothetical protein
MYQNYSWSRQIYLYREVSPDFLPKGVLISKIAWQSLTATATYTTETCYMRAIDHAVQANGYIDPLINGVSQVWTGTLNIAPGWVEIMLDTPFFLPAGKNLEIFWLHASTSSAGSTHTWACTPTPTNMAIYAQSNTSLPIISAGTFTNRPNIRITKNASVDVYHGNNLALLSFLSPVNDLDNICVQNYSPVKILIRNLGKNDYDFSKDSITLKLEVLYPQQMLYTVSVPVNSKIIESTYIDTIEVLASLPIMYAGQYELKAWLESPLDHVSYDDTAYHTYTTRKIGLPMDENFSNSVLSSDLISESIIGLDEWKVYHDQSSPIQPVFGIGLLQYVGNKGSMAQITTRHLDLTGAINPRLEFWYYHDSTASTLDRTYTDVNVIVDGISSTVLSVTLKDTLHGWKHYVVDLNPYTSAQCVLIQFKSTNKYGVQSVQYIDRILITSTADVAFAEIIISPEISACDLENKELSVVLRTMTNQSVDFSHYSASLAIEVSGYATFYQPLQSVLAGNSSDTVIISSLINIPTGVSTIKVYLSSPVDDYPSDDTISISLDINPGLSITVNPLTNANSCFKIGASVQQEIILRNTGNTDLSGIELVLRVIGDNSSDTVTESRTVDLLAGDTVRYTFTETYTVPEEVSYQVQVNATLGCNPTLLSAIHATNECADMHNLSIVSVDNPSSTQTGTSGSTESITVSLKNIDDLNSFDNVTIIASIENEQGQTLFSRLGTVPTVDPLKTVSFTFPESYTVPNDSVYYIKVYLNSSDIYPEDDTLHVQRRATPKDNIATGELNAFTLGQNIPNPANNSTLINYSVPETGGIVFHVHSISGQLLYSKTIEANRGNQSIELNTSTLAAGIYFYSIEYKGQRIVKRMSVQK